MINLIEEFPNLNHKYLKQIEEIGFDIINNEEYLKQKEFIQHGNTSIFDHCITVTCKCLQIVEKGKYNVNINKLVRAALLHDYFKYDWHAYAKNNGIHKLHGFYHPGYAAKNASREFNVSKLEENAIKAHMFPLGFAFPRSKEAWILTMADKSCALKETLL